MWLSSKSVHSDRDIQRLYKSSSLLHKLIQVSLIEILASAWYHLFIMRRYELMLIVRPDFPITEGKKVDDLIKKTIGDSAVTVKDVSILGKKNLAYPIQKLTEGIYLLLNLEAETMKVATLEKQSRLNTDVMRYLLTLKEG